MNVIQFTAVVHEELQDMFLKVCASPLQALGVTAALALMDFRIAQLASQYADQAAMLGVLDKTTGEVNLDAVEYVVTHGVTWPQQVGPFKVDKSDAEKVLAAVRIQDNVLRQPQQKEAQ